MVVSGAGGTLGTIAAAAVGVAGTDVETETRGNCNVGVVIKPEVVETEKRGNCNV